MNGLCVSKTRELDLCISCEICHASCPEDAITMEFEQGQFLPKIDGAKCNNCGLCLDLCPGIDLEIRENLTLTDIAGVHIDCYSAYSKDSEIRRIATSGGVVTNLASELVRCKEFDAAFLLHFDRFRGEPARLTIANTVSDVNSTAKSKYIPASLYNIVKILQAKNSNRYIMVGTPCQILAIRKYIEHFNIKQDKVLYLGLFCAMTMNYNAIRYFEDSYAKTSEALARIDFRSKESRGWPGDSKLYFDSGRTRFVNRNVRMSLKKYFMLNRCLFCLDKLNRTSDISLGDCYIKGKENPYGTSSVIVRTTRGMEIFSKYSHLFEVEKVSIDEIIESQRLMDRMVNRWHVKLLTKSTNISKGSNQEYGIDPEIVKRLSKKQRSLRWGKGYRRNMIRYDLYKSRILNKLGIMLSAVIASASLLECLLFSFFHRGRHSSQKGTTGHIVVVGGGLFNKGSQAMVFTVVDQIKKRCPNKHIYLFSLADFLRKEEDKSIYNFSILPWNLSTQVRVSGFIGRALFKRGIYYPWVEGYIRKVIRDADCIVDISGFSLTSEVSYLNSITYLVNILIARRHSIQFYILPQSMGPFDYPLKFKVFIYPLMKYCLPYVTKIYVRESSSLQAILKFTKKNIEQQPDIVLQSEDYDLSNIFLDMKQTVRIQVESGSVGLIPNQRVVERVNSKDLLAIYSRIISCLLEADRKVYIFRHSYEDLEICRQIKSLFAEDTRVRLVSDDLNAVQLSNIFENFDFVIASRYHSIIHSYRNNVPALVIGWAAKHYELLRQFEQLDYYFDCRDKIDSDNIIVAAHRMQQNLEVNRQMIENKLHLMRRNSIIDTLF